MSAVVGQDWRPKTLSELFVQYQGTQLEKWDHTTSIRSSFVGQKVQHEDLHPYRKKKKLAGQPVKVWSSSFHEILGGEPTDDSSSSSETD